MDWTGSRSRGDKPKESGSSSTPGPPPVEITGCPNPWVSNVIVVTGNNARPQPITEVSNAIHADDPCGGGRLEQPDEARAGTADTALYRLHPRPEDAPPPKHLQPP